MTVALSHPTASDEVLDFLLSRPTPEAIIAMRPSLAVQERLRYLLDANERTSLNDAEKAELEAFLQLGHFVRRLKIRTREKLANDL